MKWWGKSSPHFWRQKWHGKPCELQDQVYRELRVTRPISKGRLLDSNREIRARLMIDSQIVIQ